MLSDPPIEKLLPKVENRYVLSIVAAKRARQLVDGAQSLSQERANNHITQASHEILEEKVICVDGKHDIVVPLRPEVEAERLEAQRQKMEKEEEARIEESKLHDTSSQVAMRERRAKERAQTDAFLDQNARDFTAQLLGIIGQQDAEQAEREEE